MSQIECVGCHKIVPIEQSFLWDIPDADDYPRTPRFICAECNEEITEIIHQTNLNEGV